MVEGLFTFFIGVVMGLLIALISYIMNIEK